MSDEEGSGSEGEEEEEEQIFHVDPDDEGSDLEGFIVPDDEDGEGGDGGEDDGSDNEEGAGGEDNASRSSSSADPHDGGDMGNDLIDMEGDDMSQSDDGSASEEGSESGSEREKKENEKAFSENYSDANSFFAVFSPEELARVRDSAKKSPASANEPRALPVVTEGETTEKRMASLVETERARKDYVADLTKEVVATLSFVSEGSATADKASEELSSKRSRFLEEFYNSVLSELRKYIDKTNSMSYNKARELLQVNNEAAGSNTSPGAKAAELTSRLPTRMLLRLISHSAKADPEFCMEMLDLILSLVSEAPAGSLHSVGGALLQQIEDMRAFLQQFVNASSPPKIRAKALTALLGVSLSRGRLPEIIDSIKVLESCSDISAVPDAAALLRQLSTSRALWEKAFTPQFEDEFKDIQWPSRFANLNNNCMSDLILNPNPFSHSVEHHSYSTEYGTAWTDCYLPMKKNISYWEATIMGEGGDGGVITIGLVSPHHGDTRVIGRVLGSVGYHSDGLVSAEGKPSTPYGPTFGFGDLIGCGINYLTNEVFFTKNGVYLGVAHRMATAHGVCPAVGLDRSGQKVTGNFRSPFSFAGPGINFAEPGKVIEPLPPPVLSLIEQTNDSASLTLSNALRNTAAQLAAIMHTMISTTMKQGTSILEMPLVIHISHDSIVSMCDIVESQLQKATAALKSEKPEETKDAEALVAYLLSLATLLCGNIQLLEFSRIDVASVIFDTECSRLRDLLLKLYEVASLSGVPSSVGSALSSLVVKTIAVAFDTLYPLQRSVYLAKYLENPGALSPLDSAVSKQLAALTNHHTTVGLMVVAKVEKNEKITRKALSHDHPLERVVLPYNGTGWRCDICNRNDAHTHSWHCNPCRFDLCDSCMEIQIRAQQNVPPLPKIEVDATRLQALQKTLPSLVLAACTASLRDTSGLLADIENALKEPAPAAGAPNPLKRFEDASTSLPYSVVLLKCIQNVLFADLTNVPEGFPVFFTQLVVEKSAALLEMFVSHLGGNLGTQLRTGDIQVRAPAFLGVVFGSLLSLLPTLLTSLSSNAAKKEILAASTTFSTSIFKLLSAVSKFNVAMQTVFANEEILKVKRDYFVEVEKILAKLLLLSATSLMTETTALTGLEQKHAALLDGDLFKCGVNAKPATPQTLSADDQFLVDMIEDRGDSATFDQKLRRRYLTQSNQEMSKTIKSDVVDKVIRGIVACVLRHEDLVGLAAEYARADKYKFPDPPPEIREAYKAAQRARRTFLLNHQQTKKTYEELCKPVMEKIELLLRTNRNANPVSAQRLSLSGSSSSLNSSSTNNSVRSSGLSGPKSKAALPRTVADIVIDFCSSAEMQAPIVEKIIEKRRSRAYAKIASMETLSRLLTDVSSPSIRKLTTVALGDILRGVPANEIASIAPKHYLEGLAGIGTELTNSITAAVHSLFGLLVPLLTKAGETPEDVLDTLNSIMIPYQTERDYQFLLQAGLLETLRTIVFAPAFTPSAAADPTTAASSARVAKATRKCAWDMFQMIGMVALGIHSTQKPSQPAPAVEAISSSSEFFSPRSTTPAPVSVPPPLGAAQVTLLEKVLDVVYTELQKCVRDASDSTFLLLSYLYLLSVQPPARSFTTQRKWIGLLHTVLDSTSATSLFHRQVALKLLRVMLPAHEPATILKEFTRKRQVPDWNAFLSLSKKPAASQPSAAKPAPPPKQQPVQSAPTSKGRPPAPSQPKGKGKKGGPAPPVPQMRSKGKPVASAPPAPKGKQGRQPPAPAPAATPAPTPTPAPVASLATSSTPAVHSPNLDMMSREENLLEQIIGLVSESLLLAAPDPRSYSLADEAVCLLRVLQQTPGWTQHIHSFVRSAILKLPDALALKASPEHPLVALVLLGGYVDKPRVGSPVTVVEHPPHLKGVVSEIDFQMKPAELLVRLLVASKDVKRVKMYDVCYAAEFADKSVPFALDRETLSALCDIFVHKDPNSADTSVERPLLVYQLRAQGFKALQLLLQHGPNLKLFLEQKGIGSALFELAIGASPTEVRNADGPINEIERRLAALEMSLANATPTSHDSGPLAVTNTVLRTVSLTDTAAPGPAGGADTKDSKPEESNPEHTKAKSGIKAVLSGVLSQVSAKPNKHEKEPKSSAPKKNKDEKEKKRDWRINWNTARYSDLEVSGVRRADDLHPAPHHHHSKPHKRAMPIPSLRSVSLLRAALSAAYARDIVLMIVRKWLADEKSVAIQSIVAPERVVDFIRSIYLLSADPKTDEGVRTCHQFLMRTLNTTVDKSALVRSLLACAASQYTQNDQPHHEHQQQVSLAVWIVDSLLDTEQPFQEVYSSALYDCLVDALAGSSGPECEMIASLLTRLLQQRSRFSSPPDLNKLVPLYDLVQRQFKKEATKRATSAYSKQLQACVELLLILLQSRQESGSSASDVAILQPVLLSPSSKQPPRWLVNPPSIMNAPKQTYSGSYLPIMGMEGAFFSRPSDILTFGEPLKQQKIWAFKCLIHLPLPPCKTMSTLLCGANDERIVTLMRTDFGTELGAWQNSRFYGTGFVMDSLIEGWHSLAVTFENGNKTTFFVDGKTVGTLPLQTKSNIVAIGNHVRLNEPFGSVTDVEFMTNSIRPQMGIYTALAQRMEGQPREQQQSSRAGPARVTLRGLSPLVAPVSFTSSGSPMTISAGPNGMLLYGDTVLMRGLWSYEVEILTEGHIVLGWASSDFKPSDSAKIGTDRNSAGWAGSTDVVHYNSAEGGVRPYGRKWHRGDSVYPLISVDSRNGSYAVNSRQYSTVFRGMNLAAGFFPVLYLAPNQSVRVNFSKLPRYLQNSGYAPLDINLSYLDAASVDNPDKAFMKVLDFVKLVESLETHSTLPKKVLQEAEFALSDNKSSASPSNSSTASSVTAVGSSGTLNAVSSSASAESFKNWTLHQYVSFVDALNPIIEKHGSFPQKLSAEEVASITKAIPAMAGELSSVPKVNAHFAVVRRLNESVTDVFPFIDMSKARNPWSLAHRVCVVKHVILSVNRIRYVQSILRTLRSNTSRSKSVTLERERAAKAAADPRLGETQSFFAQAFRQLNHEPVSTFLGEGNAWIVKFRGEGAVDSGGPYRDSISRFCADLQSNYLPLFCQVPNAVHNTGINREKFLPNPSANSPTHLEMFSFVGKLIAVALHKKNLLSLDLPSLFWKHLLQEKCDRGDLEAVDRYTAASLIQMETDPQITGETFSAIFPDLNWTTSLSNKTTVELKPNGANLPVNFSDRHEYVELSLQARLHEARAQMDAIRAGLKTMVPLDLLKFLTWDELEMLVCGKPDIDVALLKKNTRYEGVAVDSPLVSNFWKVLSEMSAKEKSMFLRFVWGQSRLPVADKFKDRFVLSLRDRDDPDKALPESSTCFFTLNLPKYSSYDILKEKLTYSIYNCTGIDADGDDNDEDDDDMDDDPVDSYESDS